MLRTIRPPRRTGAAGGTIAALAALLGMLPVLMSVPSAHAETYRFWSYWHAGGESWSLVPKGPASTQPEDGTVEGWRFTKSSGDAGSSAKPRPDADFARICADTLAKQDTKRVAVVVDYGTAKEAPQGASPPRSRTACAQVAPDATGSDVLAAVTEPKQSDSGLVCTIDGYPQGACSASGGGTGGGSESTEAGGGDAGAEKAAVNDPAAADRNGPPLGAITGIAVAVLLIGGLGGAAAVRARRSG